MDRVHFVRVLAEGDFVVPHCRQQWPGDPDQAGSTASGSTATCRVVEHWDVLQTVPERAENAKTTF